MSSESPEATESHSRPRPATAGAPGGEDVIFTGISLRRCLRTRGGLSLADASYVIDALAETLDELHHQGRMHGAICPDNVWLMPNGAVRVFRPAPTTVPESRAHMARIGYMAPEVIAGEAPTFAADIWALGNLLFDMLAGSAAPESGPRTGEALAALGAVVAAASAIVDAANATAPEERYLTAQALANALWCLVPVAAHGQAVELPTPPTPTGDHPLRPIVFGGRSPADPRPPRLGPRRGRSDDEPSTRTQRGRAAAAIVVPSLFRLHGAAI